MAHVVITTPVINSPYDEPTRHYVFNDDGITDQIAETRRLSSYFVPIAQCAIVRRLARVLNVGPSASHSGDGSPMKQTQGRES